MAQYAMTEERKPILSRHPDYSVEPEPVAMCVTAQVADTVLAATERPLLLRESFHDPVWYFPWEDVDFARLQRTEHQTRCPFKGDASYWSVRLGDERRENVVWSYETPMEEVAGLEGYLAFDPRRVTVTAEPR